LRKSRARLEKQLKRESVAFVTKPALAREMLKRTLDAGVPAQWVSPTDAVRLVAEVADALQFAHDQGFVHFDVKPSNILIDQQGRPLLTDFGIAASTEQAMRGEAVTSAPLTTAVCRHQSAEGRRFSESHGTHDIFRLIWCVAIKARGMDRPEKWYDY
jgi:tRNA A-37 threonylcarbamoyl transferase component Bud32